MNNDSTLSVIITDTQHYKCSERVAVPLDRIAECRTLDDAFRLCLMVSGKQQKEVSIAAGWPNAGGLSLVLRPGSEGDGRRWMPHDKFLPFMVACGNSIPLQWLMLQYQTMTAVADGCQESGLVVADVLGLHSRLRLIEEDIKLMLSEFRKPNSTGQLSLCPSDERPVWLMLDLSHAESALCIGEGSYGG